MISIAPWAVRAENLGDAFSEALRVNSGLQAQQALTTSSGLNYKAAKSQRWPTVRTIGFDAFLTATPAVGTSSLKNSLGGTSGASNLLSSLPSSFPILGAGQRNLPVSLTTASVPLYTGGRLLRNIDAKNAQVGVQRNEEARTALDLKLTVAQAYIGVLRAQKSLEVAHSNVEQLGSFARDVRNRREQGLAIRNEELAAEVSLANAQISELEAKTNLESAWATYNRYLCRPLTQTTMLEELTFFDPNTDWKALATEAVKATDTTADNDGELREMTEQAFRVRPELAGLTDQAKLYAAQADVTRANIRPQASFNMSFIFLGSNNEIPQGIGAATFYVDWTITDSARTRREAAAQRQQELSALRQRADTAADVALQVRTRWLDLRLARRRVPVARLAVSQSEENIKVVSDRYRQQLSIYTEVLDAESRRIQSLNNYYNSIYDESLAFFRLRRAVGDI
jgi:outer membrane protein TolC